MAAQSVPGLTRGRLEQLVAPVALYPDRLLAPVLMAATQPLDILRAERWLARGGNATLRGDELAAAIEGEPWDPAVKALVPFPDVLRMMSRNLDWTEALGDAVAEREADVMHAVQALRRRARAGGFLRSGEEWEVSTAPWDAPPPERPWIVEPPAEAILIEPRRREDVRVPVYDPRVVYGGWDWAEHPPPYQPPPVSYGLAPALGAGIAFLGGVAVASALWGWARPAWGRGILVDAPRWQRLAPGRPRFAGEYWRPAPRGHAVGRHRAWSGQFRAPGGPPPRRDPWPLGQPAPSRGPGPAPPGRDLAPRGGPQPVRMGNGPGRGSGGSSPGGGKRSGGGQGGGRGSGGRGNGGGGRGR